MCQRSKKGFAYAALAFPDLLVCLLKYVQFILQSQSFVPRGVKSQASSPHYPFDDSKAEKNVYKFIGRKRPLASVKFLV